MEKHYNFKKKCIFIEDEIRPFIIENVKLNLKEIRNQIIKTEESIEDDDKNVCRLCLQFIDNDMLLNEVEKEQFNQFFPEIVSIAFKMSVCLSVYRFANLSSTSLPIYFVYICM